jgi:hypothetical protein
VSLSGAAYMSGRTKVSSTRSQYFFTLLQSIEIKQKSKKNDQTVMAISDLLHKWKLAFPGNLQLSPANTPAIL